MDKLEKARKDMKAIRDARIKEGLCVSCGKSLDREGSYCEDCNKHYNELKRNYNITDKNDGICTNCGKTRDREGWFCKKCAEYLRLRARTRSAERRGAGLCVQCAEPCEGSYCQRCRDMRMERYRRNKGIT